MKYLITTIAALVLVGCGAKPNYSGFYTLDVDRLGTLVLELKPDNSFIGTPQGEEDDRGIGSWKVEGDLLVCEGTTEKSSKKIVLKLNKTSLELTSMTVDGKDRRPPVPEGADGNFFKKSAPSPKTEPVEPVVEAAKLEPPTAKVPEISIHEAAAKGDIEAVKQHFNNGSDVNAKGSDDGWTPLQIAAAEGQNEIVELLISYDADVNAKADNGTTPLHCASGEGHKEIAELLISKGADVSAKDEFMKTCLHYAAQYGHKGNVDLLIAKGADVSAKIEGGEEDDQTPLSLAIQNNQTEITDLLRKHGGKTSEELKAADN
tara:strand:+ start:50 stop:1003 length:954 start_codon:yes stop_codon:yes gene_type:complete